MTIREMREKAQASIATDFAERMDSLKKYSEQVELLQDATGIDFKVSVWSLRYASAFDVTRAQLPVLRKAVGRFEVYGKNVADDFETSNELTVMVRPKAEKFNKLRFVYRTKFRSGGKCKVIEQKQSSYKTLVCEV